MKGRHKMPNTGSKGAYPKPAPGTSDHGKTGGLRKSNEMRSDVTKSPTTKHPYPHGMA